MFGNSDSSKIEEVDDSHGHSLEEPTDQVHDSPQKKSEKHEKKKKRPKGKKRPKENFESLDYFVSQICIYSY